MMQGIPKLAFRDAEGLRLGISQRIAIASLVMAVSAPAWGLDVPKPSPRDSRIRSTEYDPSNVIQVNTTMGYTTLIDLAPDEKYVTHAFGDAKAYDFQTVGQHILIKPIADQADTNLIVITDKRTYDFRLKYSKDGKQDGKNSEMDIVRLKFPDIDIKRAKDIEEKSRMREDFSTTGLAINWKSYTMSGDMAIAPASVWDDGAQTFFRFAPGQDLPVIYFVDPDGSEVVTNRHMMDPQTIVMERVAATWHLRLGNKVLGIYNSRVLARPLVTRTISPQIERVIRQKPEVSRAASAPVLAPASPPAPSAAPVIPTYPAPASASPAAPYFQQAKP
ncbi:TrbG/VirB9 family P-type conjugative transfer protein [Bordetella sp. FB-8]|uniref:TrbG/VirB9 family P-type conjugative transfer protein n=1 Tax=Bordetella sp. FB-8 TaxID=1159870 RepID=UPI00036BDAB3|nr:TrbG/VirB9 family P-type conjugative transfer protein [Bordetella sp. FB-8]